MKMTFAISATIALLASVPASAQVLGGGGLGGGLAGGLGGSLGGTLSGPMDRASSTIGSASSGSVSGEKSIDRRSGRVKGSGSASGGSVTTLDSVAGPVAANGSKSASGSANGSADAQLLGTDAVRSIAGESIGTARNTLNGARDRVGTAASDAQGMASSGGSATGNASGSFLGNAGQLAAAGSAAASGAGMFAVVPGMDVTDARGRVIGEVVSVGRNARGVVQNVVVESGDRIATLPATNFSGSGDVLVTGMTKGAIRSAAQDQEAE